jgi:hypothetical protein
MQLVKVYKEVLPSTPSRHVGSCGLHVLFECASFLAGTRYVKHEDPMGRVLVNR